MADALVGERSRAVTVGRAKFATADDEQLARREGCIKRHGLGL